MSTLLLRRGIVASARPVAAAALLAYRPGGAGLTATRASSAVQRGQDGVLFTVAADVLRDAHYVLNGTTGANERTTLLEGQRTNGVLQSEGFDTTSWTKFDSAVVTADAVAAPNGTLTADQVTLSASTSARSNQTPSVSVTAGAVYTGSVWLRTSSATGIWPFNIADASDGTFTHRTFPVEIGPDWRRIAFQVTAKATNTSTGTGLLLYLGNRRDVAGETIFDAYAWGAQLEPGAFASSYVATTTAAVSRATDAPTLAGSWTSQAVTQYERYFDLATGAFTDRVVSFTGTTAQALALFRAYTHVQVEAGTFTLAEMRAKLGIT